MTNPETSASHPPAIWMIEDSRTDAALVRHVLQRIAADMPLRVFQRGGDALDALHGADGPEALLVDLHLPDTAGDDLVRAIRATEPGRALPLAALSASDDWDSAARMYDAGVNVYLVKPMDVNRFAAILGGALRFLRAARKRPK